MMHLGTLQEDGRHRRPRVFLSYTRDTADLVESVREKLDSAGYAPFAIIDKLSPGDIWQEALQRAIEDADIFLIIVSEDYVVSNFAVAEMASIISARQGGRPKALVPVVVDDPSSIPQMLRNHVFLDISDVADEGECVRRIVNAVEVASSMPPRASDSGDPWTIIESQEAYLQRERRDHERLYRRVGLRTSVIVVVGTVISAVTGILSNVLFAWSGASREDFSPYVGLTLGGIVLAVASASFFIHYPESPPAKKRKKKKKKKKGKGSHSSGQILGRINRGAP